MSAFRARRRSKRKSRRRALGPYESVRLHPQGLELKAFYETSGNGKEARLSGASLMKDGLLVALIRGPDSAAIFCRAVQGAKPPSGPR